MRHLPQCIHTPLAPRMLWLCMSHGEAGGGWRLCFDHDSEELLWSWVSDVLEPRVGPRHPFRQRIVSALPREVSRGRSPNHQTSGDTTLCKVTMTGVTFLHGVANPEALGPIDKHLGPGHLHGANSPMMWYMFASSSLHHYSQA